MTNNDEKQIQQYIGRSGAGQNDEGLAGIADGAVNGVAEIENRQSRHTAEKDTHVQWNIFFYECQ